MTQMMSLTKYEHQVLPKLRQQLNISESVEDVKKFFIGAVQEFLRSATNNDVEAEFDEIELCPDQHPAFALASELEENATMQELKASDMYAILGRLAEQAANRYTHLSKNTVKTNLKIKNH